MTQNDINVLADKHEFDPVHTVTKNLDGITNGFTNGAQNGNGASSRLPDRHPETGIDIIIVGAGFGGLMTALECWRKGHNVVKILDRNEGPVMSGDIIVVQPSAITTIKYWPDMAREMEDEQVHAPVSYEKHSGEHIYGPTVPSFNDPEEMAERGGKSVAAAQIRRRFYRMLLRQVANLGFKVDYSMYVQDYFEDKEAGKGGVILRTGEIFVADIVVAADGLRSRSEILITGEHTPAKSSGMSIYRTAYPREVAMQDEEVRKRWGGIDAVWEYWLGPGMYIGVFFSREIVCWGFTPLDTQGNATESWESDTDPEDVVKELLRVKGWDPAIPALVRTAPRRSVVHWPLLWRNLRREWTSSGGHVVQVGDSAHSFVPTSGNGATQALEDAVTLATCLQLGGGPRNAALAAKVYNLLRYERVSCGQKMSFVNSQLKTATDWDAIWKEPRKIRTRFPQWVSKHDPEAYAYEKYGQAFAHLVAGADFKNTNFPPGHNFVPWTVEELHKEIERGTRVENLLDGDWS